MYCINCGVKLSPTEERCPLCHTTVYHPDLPRQESTPTYPKRSYPAPQPHALGFPMFLTALLPVPLCIVLLCDLRFNRAVTWSGYVVGALLVGYVLLVLPLWFRKPNPVVFLPCGFAAAGLYLLYIDLAAGGGWFLSFAFPVAGFFGLLVTAVAALLRYVGRGKLYIFGGAVMATGLFMPVMELLLCLTFHNLRFVGWSYFPLAGLVLMGGLLIFLAICRPAREMLERKFFF